MLLYSRVLCLCSTHWRRRAARQFNNLASALIGLVFPLNDASAVSKSSSSQSFQTCSFWRIFSSRRLQTSFDVERRLTDVRVEHTPLRSILLNDRPLPDELDEDDDDDDDEDDELELAELLLPARRFVERCRPRPRELALSIRAPVAT